MGAHERQFARGRRRPRPSPAPSAVAVARRAAPPAPSASPTAVSAAASARRRPRTGPRSRTSTRRGRRSCAGRRFFPIKLRRIGYTFVKAKIRVNGKRVKTIRYKSGRLGARIDLRKFPRRTIRITIVATTSTGQKIRGKRVYHPCYRGRLPHTIPEL